jgi:class 3 adenylate cyclase
VITDTERLNRAIGLGPIALEPNDDDSAARYLVRTTSGGFPLEYEERPYEWVENERFAVRRVVRRGAAREMVNVFELEPHGAGTRIKIRLEVEPKLGLLSPFIRATMKRFAARIGDELAHIDRELQNGKSATFRDGHGRARGDALARAASALRQRVSEEHRGAAELIVSLIEHAPDAVVDRIRPFELAQQHRLDRRAVLATCLQAVQAGLLEMSWDLVCPSCRTAADRLSSLADIGDQGHCQLCDIRFDLELDRVVEATFRPAANLRAVDAGPYCIGGPARTPHVVAQSIVAPGGAVSMKAPVKPGRYRLFVRGGSSCSLHVDSEGDGETHVQLAAAEGELPEDLHLAPGARIDVAQDGGGERHVKIERVDWKSLAATAQDVATLGDFRRLFSSQVLRPGTRLRVSRVALLFTDLTGSTKLYRDAGDALAFAVVQDHFDLLSRVVDRHHGAIVKTMGDAIMAAFVEEADAVRAAMAMHDEFGRFRRSHERARDCYLKIGVYAGACYCFTANGVLDYFGQSVNIAARLQGKANGGDVVLTADAADRAAGDGWLGDAPIAERFVTELKGYGEISAARIVVDSPE